MLGGEETWAFSPELGGGDLRSQCSLLLAQSGTPVFHSKFGRSLALATSSSQWPAGRATEDCSQTARLLLFPRKFSPPLLPPKEGQVKGRGSWFPLLLIKCHSLSVEQLSVSCKALGQISISVTWGLWSKARWTPSCQQLPLPLPCQPPVASSHQAPPHTQPGTPGGQAGRPGVSALDSLTDRRGHID